MQPDNIHGVNEVQDEEPTQTSDVSKKLLTKDSSNGEIRNDSTETLLFVSRVVRIGINSPHAFEDRDDATSIAISIDDADFEGGVPVGESDLNKTFGKSSSLGDGIPPVAPLDGIDGGNLESGSQTTNPTTGEGDRNGPSTPKTPLFTSPASGNRANTTPSKTV